jgi:hypothetical protein
MIQDVHATVSFILALESQLVTRRQRQGPVLQRGQNIQISQKSKVVKLRLL